MNSAYARVGVDVSVEAEASNIMYQACRSTYRNRDGKIGNVEILFDSFAGKRIIPIEGLPKGSCMFFGFDGAGSMVEVSQRMGDYSTIGHHLVAMLVDDVPPQGGEAGVLGTVLDVKTLGQDKGHLPKIRQLAAGLVEAANLAGVAVINGEIAQMGTLISGPSDFPFNWAGGCVWFGKKDRLFSGRELGSKDMVILLREKTPRTNGISLLREVLSYSYGALWHEEMFEGDTLGAALMAKPTIFSPFCNHLHGGYTGEPLCELHGFVHITGGGIPEKFRRALRASGVGATFRHVFEPPPVVLRCQQLSLDNKIPGVGHITDHDAYESLHMGQAYGIIVPRRSVNTVMDEVEKWGLEAKENWLTHERGIRIYSQGAEKPGQKLEYP